jgi:hypothetical protein
MSVSNCSLFCTLYYAVKLDVEQQRKMIAASLTEKG